MKFRTISTHRSEWNGVTKNGAMLNLPRMKRYLALFLFFIIATTCLVFTQFFFYTAEYKGTPADGVQFKNILYWTEMFGQKDFNLGLGSKIFENCPVSNCYATYNKSYLPVDQFDAILFHGVEYVMEWSGKPENRSPHQYYVYSNQESPANTPQFADFTGFFNWTMTYRLDSDVIRPYGYYEQAKTSYNLPTVEEIKHKPRKIAWMVSNCDTPSLRKLLYEQINRYIEVDVFGQCGNKTCSKNDPERCYDYLEQNYKFYLSFENSICQDYVTEKLYNVLKRNLIPIVYGGADYNKLAPPKSVIDVTNFKSVKELVDFIRLLDDNPEEYLGYFEWKKDYVVETDQRFTLCSLCKKLNEPIEYKTYNDVYKWWNPPNICKFGSSLPVILFL